MPRSSCSLTLGSRIPKESLFIKWTSWSTTENLTDKPVVFVCPSMSHSPYVKHVPELDETGWWDHIVQSGSDKGIDLNQFNVLCASPIGSPYGSTSPLTNNHETGQPWGADFPVITPEDMANAHAKLLDNLGIDAVDTVVGASMGGMQALQFAVRYPERFKKCIAIATTPATSPSAVAIRTNQRSAIINDTDFHGGDYYKLRDCAGPVQGMMLARKMGIIAYRSRVEFDNRFDWRYAVDDDSFEVQAYLDAQARKFVDGSSSFDPNCYLVLSKVSGCCRGLAVPGVLLESVGAVGRTVLSVQLAQTIACCGPCVVGASHADHAAAAAAHCRQWI